VELTEEGRRAWLDTFDPQGNEEAKVLAALEPGEQEQFNEMLRRMMRVFDRPGLLDTPDSVAGDAATAPRSRSRFTPDPGPE
jgi:hypothetical protein